jgi:hypothetical protein
MLSSTSSLTFPCSTRSLWRPDNVIFAMPDRVRHSFESAPRFFLSFCCGDNNRKQTSGQILFPVKLPF